MSGTEGLDGAAAALVGASRRVRAALAGVWDASDFVAHAISTDPSLLTAFVVTGDLERSFSAADFVLRAPAVPGVGFGAVTEAAWMAELRRWRRREFVRVAWRDLASWAELPETLADLSAIADAAINTACAYATRTLTARHGVPRSEAGEPQSLVVLGMGKLGGGELNFSSDVDLIFLFPEHGETDGPRPMANEEFFTRCGQMLVRLLDAPTEDGRVFRVDLRLRPFGASGPLVASFASFEDYLVRHGRDWERYAYVKARAITGLEDYAQIFDSAVRPFVYRRYLDFGIFESLREMKTLIEREVERRELADDVKLGPGGIREIEFIVQAYQLIRGGRDRRLQTPALAVALPQLDGAKLLPHALVVDLGSAYSFLRRLENRLQMFADAQTHRLPKEAQARARIARAMGVVDWAALAGELEAHRARVSAHFKLVIFSARTHADPNVARVDLGQYWLPGAEHAPLTDALTRAGFTAGEEAARLLVALRDCAPVRRLDEPGRLRLQALLPQLLADIGASAAPLATLKRILNILEAIGQRSVYFALLHESSAARARLVELCGHGAFLAAQIAAYPLLLDELIDERLLSELPERASLARDIDLVTQEMRDDDPERQVEALRHFQRAAVFRIAVADLTGRLPVMNVSDRLTDVAELIVERALQLGWQQMTAQFGTPMCGAGAARRAVRICAVGYGKLGGMELGYSSDLDLVFLHDSHGEQQETQADRPIDNQLFFVRAAQRIVHLLTMHSAAGRLYAVDVRLRPSGKGGLLVTNIGAFAHYQEHDAWTWEHQALLHARAIAGAPELRAEFEALRVEVLRRHVRRATLRDEVRSMRERMRRELSSAQSSEFNLKQDPGGIADIEFLAQYWALKWAEQYAAVVMFSDTIRQLESVASADLVPQASVDVLTRAYRAYRACVHHLALEGREAVVGAGDFVAERAAVTRIWNEAMASAQITI
jgi:[glutamine synthetase] adenylyltransferase / [glutamine synthetase]-adenylyl-L-tyrosine phosphorylase